MQKTKKILISLFASMFVLAVLMGMNCFAEGSKQLTENGGYRPYLEWATKMSTANIPRINNLSVYVKKGERILLGSSCPTSFDSKDIVLIKPNGTKIVLDVLATGEGYIDSFEKEQAGPFPENGGYTPFAVDVDQEGIWSVEFHAYLNGLQNDGNPIESLVEKFVPTESNQKNTVGAWDVTVMSGSEVKNGRLFTNYLSLNTGFNIRANTPVVNSIVYVLTKDGYLYKVDMNGIDPYGYIFYANNRGIIDMTNNQTLYKTGVATENNKLLPAGNVRPQMPNVPDTVTDITHRVFFSIPADDLPAYIPTQAQPPATADALRFEGNEAGVTAVGSGGTFYLDLNKNTTYEIMLDFNGNGVYDKEIDVVLSNVGTESSNSIYWNGKNAADEDVAEGTYTAYLKTKAGEYHFPLLDAENNNFGMKISLQNPPYMPEGFNPNFIYWDNTPYTTADGTYVDTKPNAYGALNPVKALEGVDSSDGALIYTDDNGNMKLIDIWTYFPGNEYSTTFNVDAKKEQFATISGFVFFDADENGKYDVGESPLGGVEITVTDKNGDVKTIETDKAGNYKASVPEGKFTIVSTVSGRYISTTGNTTQTKNASNGVVYLDKIGYVAHIPVPAPATYNYEIKKNSSVSNVVSTTDGTDGVITYEMFASTTNGTVAFDNVTGAWSYTPDRNYVGEDSFKVIASNQYGKTADIIVYITVTPTDKPDIPTPKKLTNNYAYIYGYSDSIMAAEEPILRCEASALMHRLLKQNDYLGNFEIPSSSSFADNAVGEWYYSAIEFMTYINVYKADPSSNIYPLSSISRGEAAKLFALSLGLPETDSVCNFDDLSEDNENFEYINALVEGGYMLGDAGSNTIRPEDKMTRAEYVVIYNRIIGRDSSYKLDTDVNGEEVSCQFTDMDPGDWFYQDMMRATNSFNDFRIDKSLRQDRNQLDDYVG